MLDLKNKKVLVFGLGLLGGGVATANWLIKRGAKVTITDLKNSKVLEPSLQRIRGKVKLALGGHSQELIQDNEIVVFNPDVPINNPYFQLALKLGKTIENEATLFFKTWPNKIISVTGTRGKTTTTHWISHFLNAEFKALVAGNAYDQPFLAMADRAGDWAVTELPSYHLELFSTEQALQGKPEIALITNLSPDHLNRYGTLSSYAHIKANIFKNQITGQSLILNYDDDWTDFFIKQKPAGQLWSFSLKALPQKQAGLFYQQGKAFFQTTDKRTAVLTLPNFAEEKGIHNLQNLLASALAVALAGVPWRKIQQRIRSLPMIEFRQQIIFQNRRLTIINDTAATSPAGSIAAIDRFGGRQTILIAGGTDRALDFFQWAKAIKQYIRPENLIFLKGSATTAMLAQLGNGYAYAACDTLEECLNIAQQKINGYTKAVLLFSPGAKSFEKFQNEFDRGRKFNQLIKKVFHG